MLISEQKLDPKCFLSVEAADLLLYLVLDTSYYTKYAVESISKFICLQSNGLWIYIKCSGTCYSNKYVILGKVHHLQRMNDAPVLL